MAIPEAFDLSTQPCAIFSSYLPVGKWTHHILEYSLNIRTYEYYEKNIWLPKAISQTLCTDTACFQTSLASIWPRCQKCLWKCFKHCSKELASKSFWKMSPLSNPELGDNQPLAPKSRNSRDFFELLFPKSFSYPFACVMKSFEKSALSLPRCLNIFLT